MGAVNPSHRQLHPIRGGLDAVPQIDHAAGEAALVAVTRGRHGRRGGRTGAATDDGRPDDQVVLVDQPGADGLRRQPWTVDAEVAVGFGLQPPDRLRVERPLDPRPRAGGLVERGGVDDLVGRLPDLAKFKMTGGRSGTASAVSQ